jgi:hypothetical protein
VRALWKLIAEKKKDQQKLGTNLPLVRACVCACGTTGCTDVAA